MERPWPEATGQLMHGGVVPKRLVVAAGLVRRPSGDLILMTVVRRASTTHFWEFRQVEVREAPK